MQHSACASSPESSQALHLPLNPKEMCLRCQLCIAAFLYLYVGAAEILGGLGMCIGALPLNSIPSWLCPTSALGLFFLTAAVTPANIYMYTHNAPGPLPESAEPAALPWPFHALRGVMQMVLLAVLWGIATASR
eukprot:GHUV01057108.1.p1 GENE.GHUV01057108.1~~GHUV01057108.1.p1  ORF type:complete len:134 (+),score=37.90 GHUV01057108.1:114-515(+)